MNFRKNSKGITLVALVVTIIVLLILAGVSLSLISGGNGILDKATNAVDETNEGNAKEETELLFAEIQANYYEAKYVNGTEVGTYGEYVEREIQSKTLGSGAKVTLTGENEEKIVKYTDVNGTVEYEVGTFNVTTGELKIKGKAIAGAITPSEESQTKEIEFEVEGAYNDKIEIIDSENNVIARVENTDNSCKKKCKLTIPNEGITYTFKSSIAKDTTKGTEDYTKEITLTPETTEVKVMPDGAIYWYGNYIYEFKQGTQINENWKYAPFSITNYNDYFSALIPKVTTDMAGSNFVIDKSIDITNYSKYKMKIDANITYNNGYTYTCAEIFCSSKSTRYLSHYHTDNINSFNGICTVDISDVTGLSDNIGFWCMNQRHDMDTNKTNYSYISKNNIYAIWLE